VGRVTTTIPAGIAAIAWGVTGLGMGLAYSTATLVVLESAPAGEEGAASSATQLANVLGTAVGTGIGGAIVALATGSAAHSPRAGIVLVDASAIRRCRARAADCARLPTDYAEKIAVSRVANRRRRWRPARRVGILPFDLRQSNLPNLSAFPIHDVERRQTICRRQGLSRLRRFKRGRTESLVPLPQVERGAGLRA